MNDQYRDDMHKYGRIFMVLGILVMFLAPMMIWLMTGVAPNWAQMIAGVIALSVIYLPGGLIEMMTYSPLLGTSATYLAFVTGNLINLKVPCVMNATELCKTEINTPENEVVSTISVAFSSITTVLILSLGIILLIPLKPILQSEILAPAFSWVISALFGALGYKYFKGNWKLVIAPMVLVILLSIFIPTFVNGQVIIIILIAAIVTLIFSKILFDKEMI
jgi:hypothetical protein